MRSTTQREHSNDEYEIPSQMQYYVSSSPDLGPSGCDVTLHKLKREFFGPSLLAAVKGGRGVQLIVGKELEGETGAGR